MEINEIIARNIKRIRLKQGLSQERLAAACNLHRTYIGSVERVERNISAKNIEKIAIALGVSPENLLKKENV